jgi:glycogen debranching enzyme
MARFDGDLAKAEMRTLLSSARPHGLVPHVITWEACSRPGLRGRLTRWVYGLSHFANLTQPPVLAIALEEVYRRTEDLAFLRETLPAAKRHYEHLAAERDPDGDGLLAIISPLESGMDHSPAFDLVLALGRVSAFDYHLASLRLTLSHILANWQSARIFAKNRFAVEDVAFNTVYALGLRSLYRLCREAGDPDADLFLRRAEATERALVEKCYDREAGLFYSLHGRQDMPLPIATVGSLMPLALPTLPAEVARTLVERHLLNPDSFWLPFPIPSVAADHPEFTPTSHALRRKSGSMEWLRNRFARHHLIWRGSTWVNTNWFIARGLRLHGYDEVADAVVAGTAAMVKQSGYWEYYHPYTGEGQGAEDFGWSTLLVDMLDETSPARLAHAMATRSRPPVAEPMPARRPALRLAPE